MHFATWPDSLARLHWNLAADRLVTPEGGNWQD
jgi:hypothetical protein